jgi:hypothetical protein
VFRIAQEKECIACEWSEHDPNRDNIFFVL